MALGNIRSGLMNVGEYQISPWPWVTSSAATSNTPYKIDFPMITSHLTLKNDGPGTLVFGFTQNGVVSSSNRFTLAPSQSFDCAVKTNRIFLMGINATPSYSLFAGLTSIYHSDFPVLTGSASTTSGSREVIYGPPGTPGSGTGLG